MVGFTAQIILVTFALYIYEVNAQSRPRTYAILQDTRNEPTPDGNFGYLYQTEDGIVSSARGDPSGKIQGTFSYTDPTGLKVNINYNAGSRFDRRKNAQSQPETSAQNYYNAPTRTASAQPRYTEEPQYYNDQEDYVEPQYQPRARPNYQNDYQQRRGRPVSRSNDVYNDYTYRG